MDRELAELRRAVAEQGPKRPGRRLPARLRSRVVAVVRGRVSAGESLRGLAAALGLSVETLRRWQATPAEAADAERLRPLPVEVAAPPASLTLVTPGGVRIEGLSVATAAELLTRLR